LDKTIQVYASPKIAQTFKEVSFDMDLYKGVKLSQLLEAIYLQGKKDGARSVFAGLDVLKGQISHRNPGQPRKRKKS
jgi:hypothetical protein